MTDFAKAVSNGLRGHPKKISSRYFYDAQGDALFQKIMQLPEYYPTRCELEILSQQKEALRQMLAVKANFRLVELGAGDGQKTKVLLHHFLDNGEKFSYHPVDISASVLEQLREDLAREMPQLHCQTLNYEYFDALRQLQKPDNAPLLVLFLGGNLGNFVQEQAVHFLKELAEVLRAGDRLLLGVDLMKDPEIIRAAYNDAQGVTRDFNLNLLRRINRELGGNFDCATFQHYAGYDPQTGECRSYLISRKAQEVKIETSGEVFHFDAYEPLHTEISKKYHPAELKALAEQSGFRLLKNFTDERNYFCDTMWEKV